MELRHDEVDPVRHHRRGAEAQPGLGPAGGGRTRAVGLDAGQAEG
ncbi:MULTISPECIES: hypothetical protein [Streptomyces]